MFAWRDSEVLPLDAVEPLRGIGCFETIRIHRGAPFRLQAHVARLEHGLRALQMNAPSAGAWLEAALHAVIERSGLKEGLVRFTLAPSEAGASDLHALAVPRSLPAIPPQVHLIVARSATRQTGPLSGVKTTVRDSEERAAQEAQRRGAFDAILLNAEGRAAETTSRNLFLVRGPGIVTPSLAEGALAGVTRAAVLEAAAGLGVSVSEGRVSVDDLLAAEETFLTGSGVGVLGVHRIEARAYGRAPGPLTQRLRDAYRRQLTAESRWDAAR